MERGKVRPPSPPREPHHDRRDVEDELPAKYARWSAAMIKLRGSERKSRCLERVCFDSGGREARSDPDRTSRVCGAPRGGSRVSKGGSAGGFVPETLLSPVPSLAERLDGCRSQGGCDGS